MIFRTAGRERADTGCTSGGGVCALYRRRRKQRLLYPPAAGTPDGAVTLPDDDPARQRGLPFLGYCRPQCAGIGAFLFFLSLLFLLSRQEAFALGSGPKSLVWEATSLIIGRSAGESSRRPPVYLPLQVIKYRQRLRDTPIFRKRSCVST